MATATKTAKAVKFNPQRDYHFHSLFTPLVLCALQAFATGALLFDFLPAYAPSISYLVIPDLAFGIIASVGIFILPFITAILFQRVILKKESAQAAADKRNRYRR